MPYLASNQDANNQEGFKSAMMAAGVVFGAAALGAGYLSGKLPKMGGVKNGKDVAKKLYKSNASQLSKNVTDNLGVRTAQDIADSGMTKYAMGKSWTGRERIYSKNDSLIGRFKDNHLNKDVRQFNKTIRDYKKGNFGDDVYGKSKASLYQDLYDKTHNGRIGLTSKELAKTTNDIYDSKPNLARREASGWTTADDIKLTNDIWGEAFGSPTTPAKMSDADVMAMKNSPQAQALRAERAVAKDRSADPYDPQNQEARLAERKAKAEAMRADKIARKGNGVNARNRATPEQLADTNAQLQRNFIDSTYAATGGKPRFGTGYMPGDTSPLSNIPSANYDPLASKRSSLPKHNSSKPIVEQPELPSVIQLGNPSGEYAVMNNMKGPENELKYERWFNQAMDSKLSTSKPTDPYAIANSKDFADVKFGEMDAQRRSAAGADELRAMKQVQDLVYPTQSDSQLVKDLDNLKQYRQELDSRQ